MKQGLSIRATARILKIALSTLAYRLKKLKEQGTLTHGNRGKSNIDFWKDKIERNKQRFEEVFRQLQEQGWNVVVILECEIRKYFEDTMKKLVETITNQN